MALLRQHIQGCVGAVFSLPDDKEVILCLMTVCVRLLEEVPTRQATESLSFSVVKKPCSVSLQGFFIGVDIVVIGVDISVDIGER